MQLAVGRLAALQHFDNVTNFTLHRMVYKKMFPELLKVVKSGILQ